MHVPGDDGGELIVRGKHTIGRVVVHPDGTVQAWTTVCGELFTTREDATRWLERIDAVARGETTTAPREPAIPPAVLREHVPASIVQGCGRWLDGSYVDHCTDFHGRDFHDRWVQYVEHVQAIAGVTEEPVIGIPNVAHEALALCEELLDRYAAAEHRIRLDYEGGVASDEDALDDEIAAYRLRIAELRAITGVTEAAGA